MDYTRVLGSRFCKVSMSLCKLRQKGTDRLRQDTWRVQKVGNIQHSKQRQGKNKEARQPEGTKVCLGASTECKWPQHHRHGGGPDSERLGERPSVREATNEVKLCEAAFTQRQTKAQKGWKEEEAWWKVEATHVRLWTADKQDAVLTQWNNSAFKKGKEYPVTCYKNMDEPWGYSIKRVKPDTKRQTLCESTYR